MYKRQVYITLFTTISYKLTYTKPVSYTHLDVYKRQNYIKHTTSITWSISSAILGLMSDNFNIKLLSTSSLFLNFANLGSIFPSTRIKVQLIRRKNNYMEKRYA